MNTVRIHNHGPDGVQVTDANNQITTLGEGASNVFATPVVILDVLGSADVPIETAPVPAGPTDEAQVPVNNEPATEFESGGEGDFGGGGASASFEVDTAAA